MGETLPRPGVGTAGVQRRKISSAGGRTSLMSAKVGIGCVPALVTLSPAGSLGRRARAYRREMPMTPIPYKRDTKWPKSHFTSLVPFPSPSTRRLSPAPASTASSPSQPPSSLASFCFFLSFCRRLLQVRASRIQLSCKFWFTPETRPRATRFSCPTFPRSSHRMIHSPPQPYLVSLCHVWPCIQSAPFKCGTSR